MCLMVFPVRDGLTGSAWGDWANYTASEVAKFAQLRIAEGSQAPKRPSALKKRHTAFKSGGPPAEKAPLESTQRKGAARPTATKSAPLQPSRPQPPPKRRKTADSADAPAPSEEAEAAKASPPSLSKPPPAVAAQLVTKASPAGTVVTKAPASKAVVVKALPAGTAPAKVPDQRPDRVALDEPQIVELRMVADLGARGTGGEIKMFPPPAHHGELEKWEDWSLQLKPYVGLLRPLAKRKMDDVEGSQRVTADDLSEAFDMQQTGAQSNQLLWLFSLRQVACMLAQISDGAAWAIPAIEDTEWL
ncbi:hypothetical protein AK812_SmicGene34069 [Symbiodinium microadriaticum]|uniref:Uncharacterized protein n=1 Tax=Symbiodinium microadriaticum TaxID=2951 RepID=A0A1Q9CPY6_SYMMI|nr:hypothetical protein AK812_SmicGene34069 [Symbiodinium microadriaticum]